MQYRVRPKSNTWIQRDPLSAAGSLRPSHGRVSTYGNSGTTESIRSRATPPPPSLWLAFAALVACLLPAQHVFAQSFGSDSASPPRANVGVGGTQLQSSVALVTRGTVSFRETPLNEVILILSEQWNVNIIAGSEIEGQVNGAFKNETLQSILDSILLSNGMQYQQVGNSLVVIPNSNSGSKRASFQVAVLDVPARDENEMQELIAALKLQMSPDGELVPITATGKLTMLDTPERIEAVKRLLAQIAPMGQTYVSAPIANNTAASSQSLAASIGLGATAVTTLELRPQYILANDLLAPLQMVLGGGGSVAAVEEENFLVVLGDAATHEKARLLMQQLDKPRPQVRITGYIYDVDLGELEKLGVDWGKKVMSTGIDANGVPNNMTYSGTGLLTPAAMNQAANTLSGVTTTTAGSTAGAAAGTAGTTAVAAAPGGQFLVRALSSGFELQALVQALEQTKGSRLLADPHITVVDRHLASLKVVTQVPVQQLTQTQQGGSIGSTAFKDAGITLDVTPRIANDGTIEMEVSPTYSTVSGYSNGNPIIDTRTATSVIRVNHGQALVIGGLRSKTVVETVKGIPGLMNIKYLGALFRAHDTSVRESELLVFIMPEIVGYTGGLEREMQALCVAQTELSNVSTAAIGPCTPDCKDKYCPHHQPRPRVHNGAQDVGLIGNYDTGFIDPQSRQPQVPLTNSTDSGNPSNAPGPSEGVGGSVEPGSSIAPGGPSQTGANPSGPTTPSKNGLPQISDSRQYVIPATQFDTSFPTVPE